MTYTYRIIYLLGKIETASCPPPVVGALFPNFNGEPVTMSDTEITVTFDTEQTPIALSPLVKVELL
jgi:hypothetical protein